MSGAVLLGESAPVGPQPIARREVVVELDDGPCRGRHSRCLSHGEDLYERLSSRVEVWCRYVRNLYAPGVYVWSGEALTTHDLQRKIETERAAGTQTYAESYGA